MVTTQGDGVLKSPQICLFKKQASRFKGGFEGKTAQLIFSCKIQPHHDVRLEIFSQHKRMLAKFNKPILAVKIDGS